MFGAVWSQAELRKVLGASGARVLDLELPIPHAHEAAFTDDGRLADADTRDRYTEILDELVSLAEQSGRLAQIAA